MPAPKPVMSAYSPTLMRPFSRASSKARGSRRSRCAVSGRARRRSSHLDAESFHGGLDDADIGLVGDDEAQVLGLHSASNIAFSADSTTRAPRRKTSLPSIWMNRRARRSTGPRRAVSPQAEGEHVIDDGVVLEHRRAGAVGEQDGHVAVGPIDPARSARAPTTRMRLLPVSSRPCAVRSAYMSRCTRRSSPSPGSRGRCRRR